MRYNKKIIYVMVLMCALFLSLAVYLTYFTLFQASSVIKNSYNRRIWEEEESVIRGSIKDRNGIEIAYSEKTESSQKRVYPFGSRYTHVVGYSSRTYGRNGLELKFNDMLTATDALENISDAILGHNEMKRGASLRLTLDNNLTATAERLMAGKSGAVVAIVPKTGEVLCLYSNPTFDPNEEKLISSWSDIAESEDAPFLARATSGLYAPGSTFKTVTAAAAIDAGFESFTIEDNGSYVIDGYTIKNYGGHSYGFLDLKSGFAKSSNVMFAALADLLGAEKMKKAARAFGIGEEIPFDISYARSQLNYDSDMGKTDVAALGIGQGKLLVTPLNMALVSCAIANDGIIMQPYIVEEAAYDSGKGLYKAKRGVWKSAVSYDVAQKVKELMIACVESGTGTGAKISGVTVAGKTGTAQNERQGKEHAWFIAFAPADDPEIAVCVMQEYSGASGSSCAPVAKEIIKEYLGK